VCVCGGGGVRNIKQNFYPLLPQDGFFRKQNSSVLVKIATIHVEIPFHSFTSFF
jgi:hypothetical protein